MNQVYTPHKALQELWISQMTDLGGYWHHDGALNRPYALLTSGKVSNFYANCSVVTSDPELCEMAAQHLLHLFAAVFPQPDAFCGSAYGAITLAYEMARQKHARAWFTAKDQGDEMKLDRFDFPRCTYNVAMVEDVVTTFKTTRNSIKALREKAEGTGGNILPYVFALINRTYPFQNEIDGFRIISLIEVTNAMSWDRGHNPFVGGNERVEPVRPKGNWDALTRSYT